VADNTGLFGDGMMGGYGNNITAANIIRARARQPVYQAAMENAEPNSSIRNVPDNPFQAWLKESGQRIMNPTDTIAQGVQNFTGQSDVDMGLGLMNGGMGGALGATVWHGSPHKFDKFDFSKIGTGEGAQAYGHGGYVADARKVGEGYRESTTVKFKGSQATELPEQAWDEMGSVMRKHNIPGDMVAGVDEPKMVRMMLNKYAAKLAPQEQQIFEKYASPEEGYLYKVDLPDEHIAKMLDWDKPIGQQSPDVQKAIMATKKHLTKDDLMELGGNANLLYSKDADIGGLLNTWEIIRGEPNLGEKLLKEQGIPGIKYRDSGSRLNYTVQNFHKGTPYGEPVSFATDKQAKDYSLEQIQKGFETKVDPGTRNYVVFPGNEDMLTILERNNQPLVNALRSK